MPLSVRRRGAEAAARYSDLHDGVPRVGEEAVDAFEDASLHPAAGDHLKTAWAEAFGRDGDPDDAFLEAVKAVEAAAAPIISPRDPVATLGKMIPAMRDAPHKWIAAIDECDVDRVRSMMEILWNGQPSRHGVADPSQRRSVTPEAARAAVHLAVTLVQWFGNGGVRRASP